MQAYIAATTPKGYTRKTSGKSDTGRNQLEKCWRSLTHLNTHQDSSFQRSVAETDMRGRPPKPALDRSGNPAGSPRPQPGAKSGFSSITISSRRIRPAERAAEVSEVVPAPVESSSPSDPVALRKKPLVLKVTESKRTEYRREFRRSYTEGERERDPLPDARTESEGSDLSTRRSRSVLNLDKPRFLALDVPGRETSVYRSTLSLYLSPSPSTEDGRLWFSVHPRSPGAQVEVDGSVSKPGKLSKKPDPKPSERKTDATPRRLGDLKKQLPVSGRPRRERERGLSSEPKLPGAIASRVEDPRPSTITPDSSRAQGEDRGKSRLILRDLRPTGRKNEPSGPSSWTGIFQNSSLTLREALELYRPDFIVRSKGRVQALEERARKRLTNRSSETLADPTARGRRRRRRRQNCTEPDPLSDNLFRPRERSISRKDMQLRSKRIYDTLPEVTQKKDEEKKKVLFQTNRIRAEIFKKKLLDQILQRSGD